MRATISASCACVGAEARRHAAGQPLARIVLVEATFPHRSWGRFYCLCKELLAVSEVGLGVRTRDREEDFRLHRLPFEDERIP